MSDWDDQTQSVPMAKQIYDLLEDQWKRIRRASSTVEMAGYYDQGVQAFRFERRSATKLLRDWFGPDEAADFEKLPAKLLNLHPSFLSTNYMYRELAKDEAENHAAFLFALMQNVKRLPLNLNGAKIQDAHKTILRVFVDASENPNANDSLRSLIEEYGFTMDELIFYLDDLKNRDLMREVRFNYVVTPRGLKELKRMENEEPETLEQKRFRVLTTLYDLAPNDKHGMVTLFDLAKALGIGVHEVNRILSYWDEKGMVNYPTDEAVSLKATAIDELEDKINHPNKPTQHFPSTITYINNSVKIEGGVTGNIVAGQGNTYNAITNESIASILPKLEGFISELRKADFDNRDEAIRDLEKVYELAKAPLNSGVLDVMQAKVKSAEALMKLGGWAYATYTHWPAISAFFYHQLK